jgi:NAD(P)H-hydrate epimerase
MPNVTILCGPGNNGGDGGVLARHLDAWGFPVSVIWVARSLDLRGDARAQWGILQKSQIHQHAWFDVYPEHCSLNPDLIESILADADWLVDALLGTGLSRPVTGPLHALIEVVNRLNKPVLALDLPSGLDTDTGQPLGVAVSASATATFVAPKLGFGMPGARAYTGEIAVIDIGLPRRLLEPFYMA